MSKRHDPVAAVNAADAAWDRAHQDRGRAYDLLQHARGRTLRDPGWYREPGMRARLLAPRPVREIAGELGLSASYVHALRTLLRRPPGGARPGQQGGSPRPDPRARCRWCGLPRPAHLGRPGHRFAAAE